ncbi:MAG TPA: YhbY family RNA-binding protein [Oscillospiraceae bacterium]|nr:YhbY family RNA-binding protein [Oscillospiraceae bacterium]
MLTSKQRAKLKSIAVNTDTIMQIGKGGIIDTLIKQVDDALNAREIIKLHVLENSSVTAKEAGVELANATNSELVQVIGSRVVLYRRSEDNPRINLN